MPVTGAEIFGQLGQQLEQTRREAAALVDEFARREQELQQLVGERGAAVKDLARHYLPDLTADTIARSFDDIRLDLQQIVARRDREQAELAGRLQRLADEQRKAEQDLQAASAALSAKSEELATASKSLASRLEADQTFQTLARQAVRAEHELKQNEERAAEITLDADEKLPAYERSRYFQYLWRRQYGTADYRSRGLTLTLDQWLARLIDYPRAARSYRFLTETPRLVTAEIERRRTEFRAFMKQVEDRERAAADEFGLPQLSRDFEQLRGDLPHRQKRYDEAASRSQQVARQQEDLTRDNGRFYDEALERFRLFLLQTSDAVLQQRAQSTADPRDDELVSRISLLTAQVDELRPQVESTSRNKQQVEQQLAGLEFITRRFQQAGFAGARSTFDPGFDVEQQIAQYRKGVKDREALWDAIRSAQKSEPTLLETSVSKAGDAMDHPLTQVLLTTLVQAAGVALQGAAQRSVQRRLDELGRGEIRDARRRP